MKKKEEKLLTTRQLILFLSFFSRSYSFSLQGDLELAVVVIKWTTHYDIFFLYVYVKSEIFSIVIKSCVLALSVCTYNPDKRQRTENSYARERKNAICFREFIHTLAHHTIFIVERIRDKSLTNRQKKNPINFFFFLSNFQL